MVVGIITPTSCVQHLQTFEGSITFIPQYLWVGVKVGYGGARKDGGASVFSPVTNGNSNSFVTVHKKSVSLVLRNALSATHNTNHQQPDTFSGCSRSSRSNANVVAVCDIYHTSTDEDTCCCLDAERLYLAVKTTSTTRKKQQHTPLCQNLKLDIFIATRVSELETELFGNLVLEGFARPTPHPGLVFFVVRRLLAVGCRPERFRLLSSVE